MNIQVCLLPQMFHSNCSLDLWVLSLPASLTLNQLIFEAVEYSRYTVYGESVLNELAYHH